MNDLEQTNMLQPLVDEIETAVSNAKKEIPHYEYSHWMKHIGN